MFWDTMYLCKWTNAFWNILCKFSIFQLGFSDIWQLPLDQDVFCLSFLNSLAVTVRFSLCLRNVDTLCICTLFSLTCFSPVVVLLPSRMLQRVSALHLSKKSWLFSLISPLRAMGLFLLINSFFFFFCLPAPQVCYCCLSNFVCWVDDLLWETIKRHLRGERGTSL